MSKAKLYLFPTPISDDTAVADVLPLLNLDILKSTTYFVVENVRTARRFISKCRLGIEIDSLHFVELSEHTPLTDIDSMLKPIGQGHSIILMSEAGVPAVADPGSELVSRAHDLSIEVVPLVGPSSIIMSLMCSGMNGQSFTFNGYLPIKNDERKRKLDELSRRAISRRETQIFIETPYRNAKLFEYMLQNLPSNIKLCVAANISSSNQYIKTKTIAQWRNSKEIPAINKIPAIFIIG